MFTRPGNPHFFRCFFLRWQVLTEGYIREVDGGRRDGVPFADSVRSFAMNYALQCFEQLGSDESIMVVM
jgi:hypothetical protein